MAKKTDYDVIARNLVRRKVNERIRKYKEAAKKSPLKPKITKADEAALRESYTRTAIDNALYALHLKLVKHKRVTDKELARRSYKSSSTAKSKNRLTNKARKNLKQLSSYETDFNEKIMNLPEGERNKMFVELTEIERQDTIKGTALSKSGLEVLRMRLLESKNTPPEIKEYLRKADLITVNEFAKFVNMSKKKADNYSSVDYAQLFEDYWKDDISAMKYGAKKTLLNFIKYQYSVTDDPDRLATITKRAMKIKKNGKQIITLEDIRDYL